MASLVGCCSKEGKTKPQAGQTGTLQSIDRLPAGYPRMNVEVVPWGTKLTDLQWLAVVSDTGDRKIATQPPVTPDTPLRELREAFTFINGALTEVRGRRTTMFGEQDLQPYIDSLQQKYGDATIKDAGGALKGNEYVWNSKRTRLSVRCSMLKDNTFEIITTWREVQ